MAVQCNQEEGPEDRCPSTEGHNVSVMTGDSPQEITGPRDDGPSSETTAGREQGEREANMPGVATTSVDQLEHQTLSASNGGSGKRMRTASGQEESIPDDNHDAEQQKNKRTAGHVCEMCGQAQSKYCCPGCSCRTCSLACVNQHKVDRNCSGKRDRLAFVPLQEFDDRQLLSDYRLLEEISRADDVAKRCKPPAAKQQLPPALANLVYQADRRRVKLLIMPPGMHRRKTNTTRYDGRQRRINWKVEWEFHSAKHLVVDDSVPEGTPLNEVLAKHITWTPGSAAKQFPLAAYSEAGVDNLKVFMRKARTPANAPVYYALDITRPLGSQLAGKMILEYPTFIVALPGEESQFPLPVDRRQPQQHQNGQQQAPETQEEDVPPNGSAQTQLMTVDEHKLEAGDSKLAASHVDHTSTHGAANTNQTQPDTQSSIKPEHQSQPHTQLGCDMPASLDKVASQSMQQVKLDQLPVGSQGSLHIQQPPVYSALPESTPVQNFGDRQGHVHVPVHLAQGQMQSGQVMGHQSRGVPPSHTQHQQFLPHMHQQSQHQRPSHVHLPPQHVIAQQLDHQGVPARPMGGVMRPMRQQQHQNFQNQQQMPRPASIMTPHTMQAGPHHQQSMQPPPMQPWQQQQRRPMHGSTPQTMPTPIQMHGANQGTGRVMRPMQKPANGQHLHAAMAQPSQQPSHAYDANEIPL